MIRNAGTRTGGGIEPIVISEDDKKALEDLVDLARHELWNDHRYLDELERVMARAEKGAPQGTIHPIPATDAVYRVHFSRGLPKKTGAKEKQMMESGTHSMLISDVDLGHVRQLLAAGRRFLARNHQHLHALEENLTRALVVTRDQIPRDVIAIHTQVRIHELDIGRQSVYTVVLPGEADVARNRISVLAPIGSALLGRRVGDLVECAAPPVTKRLKVKEIVQQPEAVQVAA